VVTPLKFYPYIPGLTQLGFQSTITNQQHPKIGNNNILMLSKLPHSFFNLTKISPFILASLMLWRRNEGGELNRNRRRCKHWAKIPVKTFLVMKRINTELFIDGKEGSDQKDRIKKIWELSEEGRILAEIKVVGVKTAVACLGELTITGLRSQTTAGCLKWLWTCKVKNTVARKRG